MAKSKAGEKGSLRIIGGQWRGRKLPFDSVEGLRPTPDRVRETLFNWLTPDLPGARCLDLYAGSGALGLEALSRGAGSCQFVECDPTAADNIKQHLTTLQAKQGRCLQISAGEYLQRAPDQQGPFDIVFLDPPFDQDLLPEACAKLEQHGWLADSALIYIESAKRNNAPPVPERWRQHRDKTAGEVRYQLFVQQ
jgi:16S rRNA (guanine966-N2)-methyltransferase